MSAMAAPASAADAVEKLQILVGYLADVDAASLPAVVLAQLLQGMEQADAVATVAWAQMLAAYDAQRSRSGDLRKTVPMKPIALGF